MDEPLVAGIDRWRGGWVIAIQRGTGLNFHAEPTIDPVLVRLEAHQAVAIDMPIALAREGRRAAEAEVRAVLGPAARSVFTSPTRAALAASSQAEATSLNRANAGPGISAQAFGLFASIVELRDALGAGGFDQWWETHPETAFTILNDGCPLASKKTGRGAAQRLALLRDLFPSIDEALLDAPERVPLDDLLDAAAAAWSARRIAQGTAQLFGSAERDDQGFGVGIRV